MSVIIKLLSKFDDSGLKKAKSGFGGLSKTLGAIGIGFGLKQLTDGLLDAAKAAAADEKSTRLLNIQLTRNAGATAASLKENDKFIESLSLQTGIMDDDLRPAMARFGNVTGNVKQAQKLLKISLDGSAGSGKNIETVSKAVAKAYGGNTTALKKMFPELMKSKDVLGDFAKTYEGLAEENADPFMKFNNSMDILKEKLGTVVLPILLDFIDEISKPGGAIEVVGKFFDDLANPKSDAGKTFEDIKKAVGEVITGVKDFFALFGNGDAIEGFKNIATSLVTMLPALLALKGIMMLAAGGKAIASLVTAMGLIAGKGATPTVPPVAAVNPVTGFVAVAAASQLATQAAASEAQKTVDAPLAAKGLRVNLVSSTFTGTMAIPTQINPVKGDWLGLKSNPNILNDLANPKKQTPNVTNNVTINVPNADPKAVYTAWNTYLKQNGGKSGR
jgi:hypothetical protein